ncbi:MAG TPA: MFS transporter [Streptosporangiaceae bacterium]|nr:MFS transporter [Streptosporangiaceae bacterium]
MFSYRSTLLDGLRTESPRPQVVRGNPRAPWLAVGVVCFGAFMGQLDASIVTLTFRPMEHDFAEPLAAVQWVSLAYLLLLVALVTPAGRLADSAGRKLIYGYGFVVFTIGSAACGLAPSLGILIGSRLFQAAGAAMLQSNSVALVTTSVPRERMRLALSVQAAAQSLGLGLGPTLGGLLTQTVGWRAVYWINVPVGILAVVAGRYLLPRTRQRSRFEYFDWPGAALLGTATTALLVALSVIAGLPAPGWFALVMVVVALAAGLAFAVRQLRARFPLIPSALLHSPRLVLGLAGAFLGYLALFGPLVLVPQLLDGHGNAARTGLILSALPVGFGVAALTAEWAFPASLPNRVRGCIGAAVSAVALVMLIFSAGSTVGLVVLLGLAGLGLGVFVPANNAVIMRSAAASSAAVLGGLVNMARGIGTTFGIALVTLALHLTGRTGGEHADGTVAFAVLAVAAGCAAAIAMGIRPLSSRNGRQSDGEATG